MLFDAGFVFASWDDRYNRREDLRHGICPSYPRISRGTDGEHLLDRNTPRSPALGVETKLSEDGIGLIAFRRIHDQQFAIPVFHRHYRKLRPLVADSERGALALWSDGCHY